MNELERFFYWSVDEFVSKFWMEFRNSSYQRRSHSTPFKDLEGGYRSRRVTPPFNRSTIDFWNEKLKVHDFYVSSMSQ